jgi:formylmethanofuran dehydrogenase subunit E
MEAQAPHLRARRHGSRAMHAPCDMERQERTTERTSRPTDGCQGNTLANDCACGAEGLRAESLTRAVAARNRPSSRRALFLIARQALALDWSDAVLVSEHVEDPMGPAHRSKRQRHDESTGRYLSAVAQSSFARARTVFAVHTKSDHRRKPLRCVRCNSVLQARTT